MFRAAFVGWLIGKLIVGLVQGVMRLVEGVAYLVGAAGGFILTRGWPDPSGARPSARQRGWL